MLVFGAEFDFGFVFQPDGERVVSYHVHRDKHGLQPSVVGLEFKVKPEYFKNGSMKVRFSSITVVSRIRVC